MHKNPRYRASRTTRGFLLVSLVGAAAIFSSCRGATEILLTLHTTEPCTQGAPWRGVAVYAGAPGLDLETRAPATTSASCDGKGSLGTLAIVPSGAKDETIGIRVVAGITRAPEECAANAYDGCIVARRTIAFLPHETLELRIDLDATCVGQGCDALHSCVNGSCVDARLMPTDPPVDAGPEVDAGALQVRCGDKAEKCATTGDTCCVNVEDAGGVEGTCEPAVSCPPTGGVLQCDSSSQCADGADGGARICCLLWTGAPDGNRLSGSQCLPLAECYLPFDSAYLLCEDRSSCLGKPCVNIPDDVLPHYHWCILPPP